MEYEVSFYENVDPYNVMQNYYDAKDSNEARKKFLADVKRVGGKPSDVAIVSARRTYSEGYKKISRYPSGTEKLMEREWR
jgi:hypothetical protein